MLFNTFTFVIILFVMVSFDQTLLFLLGFRLEPIFITASVASKSDTQFKSHQIQLENNHNASLI